MTQTIIHVPASEGGGAFDPTDIVITDNTSGAFLIKDDAGSPHEYMRINTTNGSERIVLKGKPSNNAQLLINDQPFMQGDRNNLVQAATMGLALSVNSNGNRIENRIIHSTSHFAVQDGSSNKWLKIENDSNATFTLDDASGALFKVTNDAESYDYLSINEANNRTTIQTGTSSSDYIILKSGGYETLNIDGNTNVTFNLNNATSAKLETKIGGNRFARFQGNSVSAANYVAEIRAGSDTGMQITGDSEIAFTLDDGNNAVFKVQDDAGTPTNLLKIDTTGTNDIEMNAGTYDFKDPSGNQVLKYDASNSFRFGTDSSGGVGAYRGVGDELIIDCLRSGGAKIVNKMRAHGGGHGDKFQVRSNTNTNFEVDQDSNATFTLDDGSGALFKVVNDAGSPKTFLQLADGGSTFLDSENATYLRAQGHSHIVMTGSELQFGASGKYVIFHNGYPIYKRSPNLLDLGATTGTTVVNFQSDGAYKKIKCTPTTSSQTFTLEFQDGSSTNRDYVIEQDFAIHNAGTENCTIQATVTSGRGSALGKDLSAGGATSGELVTGMTLNAGKSALFKAFKWNKELAGSAGTADNEFMFQTIMVEA